MYGLRRRSRLRVHEVARGVAEPKRVSTAEPLLCRPGSPSGTCAKPTLDADQEAGEHAMRMMDCDRQTTSRMVALPQKPPSYRYQNIW